VRKKAKGRIILHLSFYICHLSLKKCGSTNDKCKMILPFASPSFLDHFELKADLLAAHDRV
jgi:hypothetical protein